MPEGKSYGRSKAGVELTHEVLDRMADEAEQGLDVTRLRRRPGRPAMGIGRGRVVPGSARARALPALDERAAADEMTASEVVREALRRYLKVS